MQQALRHPTILAVIGLATAVFVRENTSGVSFASDHGVIPVNVIDAWSSLIAGDVGTSTLAALFTTISGLFLHGSPQHILMNSVFLWLFGSLVSEHLGKWWALACFFVCGIGGFALHIFMNKASTIPCIGASGAVAGLEGVFCGLILQWRLPWPDVWPLARPIPPMQLAAFAVIGIGFDLYGIQQQAPRIAFAAHVGGFLTGLLISGIITQCVSSARSWKNSRWYV